MEDLLAAKTLLMIGGTGTLGSELVRQALDAGARVHFTYHQSQAQADKLQGLGARKHQIDLASASSIEACAKRLKEEKIVFDIVIHNAAIARDGTITALSEEDWQTVMDVNLKGPYLLMRALYPLLAKTKKHAKENVPCGAKLFFLISRTGLRGTYGAANYAASKAGLVGFARSLAKEWASRGILVNMINPGFMRSRMTESLPEKVLQKNVGQSLLGKFSDPKEVARFLLELASDKMSQVTGQIFHLESREIL